MGNSNLFYPEAIYRLLRNPSVTIDDWPEPDLSDDDDDDDKSTDEPDGGDQDPDYIERLGPPGIDDEAQLTDNELRAMLKENLEFMDDEEWDDLCELYPLSSLKKFLILFARFTYPIEEGPKDSRAAGYAPAHSLLTHDLERPSVWRLRRAWHSVRVCRLAPTSYSLGGRNSCVRLLY